jgi:ABC-2 type transport system ATP-binding protein
MLLRVLQVVAISTERLTRRFDKVVALNELTVDIPSGQVVGLVGPNGSGKSTLIRLLLGLIRPTSGTASVLGTSIREPQEYADRVGALIESPSFIGSMSARSNLKSLAALRGLPSSRIDEVLSIVGLTGRDSDNVRTYSLGMKQRLAIAAALLPDPELLILDEPTNGLDPSGIVEIRELLKRLGTEGRTVVVSSHLMAEMQAMCDYLVVVRFGHLLYSGPLDDLLNRVADYVIATPEHLTQVGALNDTLRENGMTSEVVAESVHVSLPADEAAAISRAAAQSGIYLRALEPTKRELESVFLELTGATDAAVARMRVEQQYASRETS